MSRLLLPLGCASLLVTLAACGDVKGVEVDARALIPAGADLAFGADIGALQRSPLGPILYTAAQTQSDLQALLASVPNCAVDPAGLRLTFAGVVEQDDRYLLAVEGPGIGNEDNLKCLEREHAKALGKTAPTFLWFTTRGDVRTIAQEGGGALVILNKNTVLAMSGPWESTVFDAIEKPELRVTDSALAKAVAAVDPATDLWVTTTFSEAERAALVDLKGAEGIQTLTSTADLTNGVDLTLTLDTSAASHAVDLKTSVDEALGGVKAGLAESGLPANLLDTATTEATGNRFTARLELATDVLPALIGGLAGMFAQTE
jgi:hypothetical protein